MSDLSILFEPVKARPPYAAQSLGHGAHDPAVQPEPHTHGGRGALLPAPRGGGTGLIITEGTTLRDLASSGSDAIPAISGEVPVAGWAKVVEAVHAAGSKIFPQIWHMGVMRDAQASGHPEVESLSPSGLLLPGKSQEAGP